MATVSPADSQEQAESIPQLNTRAQDVAQHVQTEFVGVPSPPATPNATNSPVRARSMTRGRGRGRGRSARISSAGRGRGRGDVLVQADGGSSIRGRGRGRVSGLQGRGRAVGRGRGRRRTRITDKDPSQGWTIVGSACEKVMMEKDFADTMVHNRARLFCRSSVSKMKLELTVREIIPTRAGFMVLMMNGLLRQLTEWMGEYVVLNGLDECVTLPEMYRFVAVVLFSHNTGLSYDKSIEVLRLSGCVPPSL